MTMLRNTCALASLLFALGHGTASAGRTNFGWLTTTEVVPDRTVELESRISDENDKGPLHERSTSLWLSPAIGLTNCVELHLPVELTWQSQTGQSSDFSLSRFGADVRYSFGRTSGITPLIRFGLARDVRLRNLGHAELDVAVAYERGAVQLLADIGLALDANRGGVVYDVRPGAGVSLRVHPEVRLGAELYTVRSFDSAVESWAVVGPTLAWKHDRFWFAGSFGVGVQNISSAGRLVWGVDF